MPLVPGEMSGMEPVVDAPKASPVFTDDGTFLVDEQSGETGTYHIDTRVVQQASSSREWETNYRLTPPKGTSVDIDSEDYLRVPNAYRSEGEVTRLFEETEDPEGKLAKQVHVKVLELLKKNTKPDVISEEVRKLVDELEQ